MGRCPCGSDLSYEGCCGRFHLGELPKTALELMRSRYAAYALDLPRYIIETTHRKNRDYSENIGEWEAGIRAFSRGTRFERLEIVDFEEMGSQATVTFIAHLEQNGKKELLREKSFFEKVKGKWLYRSGELYRKLM